MPPADMVNSWHNPKIIWHSPFDDSIITELPKMSWEIVRSEFIDGTIHLWLAPVPAYPLYSPWKTTPPEKHGYYLGAWKPARGTKIIVSELWFNPEGGWFTGRGYMRNRGLEGPWRNSYPIEVIAWCEIPKYERKET